MIAQRNRWNIVEENLLMKNSGAEARFSSYIFFRDTGWTLNTEHWQCPPSSIMKHQKLHFCLHSVASAAEHEQFPKDWKKNEMLILGFAWIYYWNRRPCKHEICEMLLFLNYVFFSFINCIYSSILQVFVILSYQLGCLINE